MHKLFSAIMSAIKGRSLAIPDTDFLKECYYAVRSIIGAEQFEYDPEMLCAGPSPFFEEHAVGVDQDEDEYVSDTDVSSDVESDIGTTEDDSGTVGDRDPSCSDVGASGVRERGRSLIADVKGKSVRIPGRVVDTMSRWAAGKIMGPIPSISACAIVGFNGAACEQLDAVTPLYPLHVHQTKLVAWDVRPTRQGGYIGRVTAVVNGSRPSGLYHARSIGGVASDVQGTVVFVLPITTTPRFEFSIGAAKVVQPVSGSQHFGVALPTEQLDMLVVTSYFGDPINCFFYVVRKYKGFGALAAIPEVERTEAKVTFSSPVATGVDARRTPDGAGLYAVSAVRDVQTAWVVHDLQFFEVGNLSILTDGPFHFALLLPGAAGGTQRFVAAVPSGVEEKWPLIAQRMIRTRSCMYPNGVHDAQSGQFSDALCVDDDLRKFAGIIRAFAIERGTNVAYTGRFVGVFSNKTEDGHVKFPVITRKSLDLSFL